MQINAFPHCCAGLLLSEFGGTTRTLGQTAEYPKEEIIDFMQRAEIILRDKGFALLTINNQQLEFMKPILEAYSYECVGKDIPSYGHYGSKVYIYLKINRR